MERMERKKGESMKVILITAGILAVVYLLFSYALAKYLANIMYYPAGNNRPTKEQVIENLTKQFAGQGSADAVGDYESFENWEKEEFLLANNGVDIPAWFYPLTGARGCAILAHGFGQNHYAMLPQAEIFRKLNFSVLMLDERAFGESQAKHGGFSELEATDIAALAKWIKQRCGSETKIVALGVSMGAMSVMNALALTDLIDYCIEDCGPARLLEETSVLLKSLVPLYNPFVRSVVAAKARSLGLHPEKCRPVDAVAKSTIPVLVVHGEKDRAVPVDDAREIFSVCKNPSSRIVIFPGRDHAFSVCDRKKDEDMLADFLKDV